MKHRSLGSTGIQVSPLGFGTVKLGRDRGVKYPSTFSIPNNKEALNLITLAKEQGVNLIDTAPAYGNSEERLGVLLKNQRHDFVICSKAGEEFDSNTGESTFNFSPKHIRYSIERSLKRLKTDYLDIVMLHSDGNDEAIIDAGALDALNEIKRAGLIRATGMSTKTIAGGIKAAQHSDVVMVTYNLAYQDEISVLDFCQQHNKGVFIKKALASGHVFSKDDNALQKSMDFIFSHTAVTSTIVGTINPAHLLDNIQAITRATHW